MDNRTQAEREADLAAVDEWAKGKSVEQLMAEFRRDMANWGGRQGHRPRLSSFRRCCHRLSCGAGNVRSTRLGKGHWMQGANLRGTRPWSVIGVRVIRIIPRGDDGKQGINRGHGYG
jgi:hypothetical protein